ncbi:MAG: acetylornithine/succinylornithine family transaminase [Planctomycetes bacterium]|nr:acetylornithine/succinylornithine family transaminase [Planctomycetota bacterium]
METKLEEAQRIHAAHHLPTYARNPLMIVGGEGDRLLAEDGRWFHDFLGGIAVNALGYGDPRVKAALAEAGHFPLHTSNLFHHPWQAPVIAGLVRLCGLPRVFLSNSGTEANEGAMKLARLRAYRLGQKERTRFVAFEGSFHGRTFGALSVTASAKYREPYEPLLPGVSFVPFGSREALEAAVDERTAAVILEPVQGEGGLRTFDPEMLRHVRELCTARGALLIADEIQCGLGRTGKVLACHHAGVLPDIVTLAKPLGCGLPLGAVLAAEHVSQHVKPGDHGTTFGGNPVACRLAMILLSDLEDGGLLEHVRARGAELRAGLERLKAKYARIREIRGLGLMLGLDVEGDAAAIVKDGIEHGYLFNRTAETVLRIVPPLTVKSESIARFVEYLDGALARTAAAPAPVA